MAHNKLYRNFIILQEDENKKSSSNEKALSGYAKIEAKGDKCKITFYAQNLKRDGDYSIVLICHKKDMKKIIDMGKINVNEVGKGEACKEYYVDNIAGLDMSYDKISGAGICKNINSDPVYLMYGFMNGEKPESGWKKCKITKCAEEGSKAKTYTKKESDKLMEKHKEMPKKEEHKEKEYHKEIPKMEEHKEKEHCKEMPKKEEHKEKEYHKEMPKKEEHKEKEHCKEMPKKEEHKEKEHHKDYELCEDGHKMKEYNKDDHKEKDCEDHKKKDHEEKEKKEHKEKDKKDKCNVCREEDESNNTLNTPCESDNVLNESVERDSTLNDVEVSDNTLNEANESESTLNQFNDYEKEIAKRIEEENIDPYDFKLRGGIGEYFEGLVQGFEEVKGKIKELKYCKWFKIPVLDIEDMCDSSNHDRYSIIFYPMLNYYPYIRKHRHFMFGYKCDSKGELKYLVYAIPGRRDREDQPYGGKSGFVTWCRARGNDEMGYWLMFYDYKNSTIVVPSK
ncbi:hypothetical protein [Clostridium baratii]|uniref:hypothetical protein n=1 Tax=Clostridium baratii TaxID=1561 RepID=UPI002A748CD1|nr:hypothetical protein [Clostridium baratii]MDY3207021.1 hypothetical protein [Clostridium baratii]